MLEIRRRIITDHSYNDIMRDLHLSERTFYRYRGAVFAHDREQMRKLNDEEVLNQLAILRDRCNTFYQESRKIANNSSLEAHARVDALHLAGEYALLIFKTYTEAPPVVLAALSCRRYYHRHHPLLLQRYHHQRSSTMMMTRKKNKKLKKSSRLLAQHQLK
jgi:hypothetical protein